MSTPLEQADLFLKQLQDRCQSFPSLAYTQVGSQVVGCESLIVAVTGVDGQALGPQNLKCDFAQIGTFVITVARDCAIEFDDEGFDDPVEISRISQQIDADGDCLWAWAQNLDPYLQKDFSIAFDLTGGIAITSLQLTIGIL